MCAEAEGGGEGVTSFQSDSAEKGSQSEGGSNQYGEPLTQFDVGIMAEEASRAGDVEEAERLYRRAFQMPDESNDPTWLIGSYCNFLREHDRANEAFELLKRATSEGNHSRYLWNMLLGILADREDIDGMMDLIRRAPAQAIPTDQVAAYLMGFTHRRDIDVEFCERLCRRAREFARAMGDRPGEWLITGRLGQMLEALGRIDEAVGEWSEAFRAGSDDPTTAVRLSMALDKAKRFDEAQVMIQDAMTRGLPASSEENLKKRLARLEARRSPTKERKDVTAFSVRFGEGYLKLRYQVRLKPTLKEVSVIQNEIRAHCAAKEINEAVRIDLQSGEEIGRTAWPVVQLHFSALDGWGIGERDAPRVGSGPAELTFFGPDDAVVATNHIPDSTSGVAQGFGQWYVGCRDGRLYCFDRRGALKWKWVTPGADDAVDDVYARPCPYYVTATDDFVTFSSWDNLFALSNTGELLWQRKVPDQGPITITVPRGGSFNMDSWKVLGLSRGASDDDIKRAYHRLALDTHPDRNPSDPDAAGHFRMIQSAYESLLAAPHQDARIDVVKFTFQMKASVSRLFALNNEIVVVSSDGVMAFLTRNGEVTNRRVLGRSAARPVFDSSGVLRAAFCDGILSFFDGDSIVNAAEIGNYPESIVVWGDDVIVVDRLGMTLYSKLGVKLWTVEFAKRLAGFSAQGDALICSAGALVVFERVH